MPQVQCHDVSGTVPPPMKPSKRRAIQRQAARLRERIDKRDEPGYRAVDDEMSLFDPSEPLPFTIAKDPSRTALAVSMVLLEAAAPLPADGVVEPGSLLVEGGEKGQRYISRASMPGLIKGFQVELGLRLDEIRDALRRLEARGVFSIVDGPDGLDNAQPVS